MGLNRVFCLEESLWDSEEGLRSKTSVLPVLETLERQELITFVHRHAATRGEFDWYMQLRKNRRTRDYGLIYLAFHGDHGGLALRNPDHEYPTNARSAKNRDLMAKHTVSLEELADQLGRVPGAVIHLSSCSVFPDNPSAARKATDAFLATTQARALCGYRSDVDWVESAALDQILISYLAHYSSVGRAFSMFRKRHRGLIDYLKWRAYEPPSVRARPKNRK